MSPGPDAPPVPPARPAGPLRLFRWLDALLLRLPLHARFVRFGIVGASGVLVNLGTLALLRWLLPSMGVWTDRVAMGGGIVVSIVTNFVLNDSWTWADRDKGGASSWWRRLGKFALVSALGASLQWGAAVAFHELWGLWVYASQLAGIVLALVLNFALNHLWTFGASPPAQPAQPEPPVRSSLS